LGRIEENNVIPGAVFHNEILLDAASPRCQYIEAAWRRFAETDIIFFDPDNGIEIPSKDKGRKGSSKYVYWDELGKTYKAGHSILIYQHFPHEPRDRFIRRLCKEFRDRVSPSALWTIRTPHVVFFLLGQAPHVKRITRGLQTIPKDCERDWLRVSRISAGRSRIKRHEVLPVQGDFIAPTIIRLPAVKARTGLARSTIYLRILEGTFPKPIALGPHAVGWIESEVTKWIEQRIAESRQY
jgi:predicted DNA-binding transcriptional regulator AlpA